MDNIELWKTFLIKMQDCLSPMAFETWFSETSLSSVDNGIAKIIVPMSVHKTHLAENYHDLISEILTSISFKTYKLEFYLKEEITNNIDVFTNNTSNNNQQFEETGLNPNYTFENFIVGESNRFARATSLAVAEKPGFMYNPLFIYGNSGLGKTHLMHAIGNYIVNNSNKKVLYVTSEKFVSDFIKINQKNSDGNNYDSVDIFKRKYRDIDVLMIDDIQYLGGANQTQQEFFNTFNDLYGNNKQIIISSDTSPDDLKLLEDRLRTRFNWGLTIDILPPDFNLRMNIIDKKIESQITSTTFPQDVREYIASNCTSDVRKIEGAITRVFAYSTIINEENITFDIAVEALKDYFVKSVISKNKIDQVKQLVANAYNISVDEMKGKKRGKKIIIPRQIAMYICRVYLEETFPKIGIEFGGRDHSTVINSVNKIAKELKNNDILEIQIQKIINQIK